jgi:type IV pilus assembly protein PilM
MPIFNNKLNAFGLDLSDRSIKVAQLKKNKEKISLYSYGREDIPEGLIVDGEIINEEEVAKFIKKTLSSAKPNPIKSKIVIYSIPEPKGFIRVVKVSNSQKDNIEQAIKYEAEQLFPVDINESYLDWQIISSEGDEINAIVAVVPKLIIDSYSSVIVKAGLKPIAAEIESIAITRSLVKDNQSSRPILIIDLGRDRTSFIIFKNPAVQFTASIPICGEEFTKAISENLGINKSKAEIMKEKCGLTFEGECRDVFKAIQPSLYEMIKYINKLTYYYKDHFKLNEDIVKVIICGGEAKMFGLSSFLSLQIKKEIEKGNPWVNIIAQNNKKDFPISRNSSLVFVTVLGLAIRGIKDNAE